MGPQKPAGRETIAHHLILTGYGHWLPGDPRGSGSTEIRNDRLKALGPIHQGRKKEQPSRRELRECYQQAVPRLAFKPIRFDEAKRQAIGQAFALKVAEKKYTVWACAVCSNHAHLVVRRHRHDALTMWRELGAAAQQTVRASADVPDDHPVWSGRPYKVFLYAPAEVRGCIRYVNENPPREGLAAQAWPFVLPYNGWPLHHRRGKGAAPGEEPSE